MNWTEKVVLVTGADGFIGSHLVEKLHSLGCKVKALSYYNSFNHWGWLEELSITDSIEVLTGDVRDRSFCTHITKDVDIVFHLAALIAIPYSYSAPESYIDTNIKGSSNICLAALDNGCQRIIHTSTSEVYGTAQFVPITEEHPLQPQSPYSASKIAADSMVMSYYNAFDLPLTIARPFNTFGPRQSLRAVIPSIITQIASGKDIIKIGATTPTRDFNFVQNTCDAFVKLAESSEAIGKTIHFGSGREISIADLFPLIANLMNKDVTFEVEEERLRPEKSEVQRLLADNSKIQNLSDYSPKVSLEEGLSACIDWYSYPKNLQKFKTDIYNV